MPRPTVLLARRRQSEISPKPLCTEGFFPDEKAARYAASSPRYSPTQIKSDLSATTSSTRANVNTSLRHAPAAGSLQVPAAGSLHVPAAGSLHAPATGSLHAPSTGSSLRAPAIGSSLHAPVSGSLRLPAASMEDIASDMLIRSRVSLSPREERTGTHSPRLSPSPSRLFAEDTAIFLPSPRQPYMSPRASPTQPRLPGTHAEEATAGVVQAWGSLLSPRGSLSLATPGSSSPVQAPTRTTVHAPKWTYQSVQTPREDIGSPRTQPQRVEPSPRSSPLQHRRESSPPSSPKPSCSPMPRKASPGERRLPSPEITAEKYRGLATTQKSMPSLRIATSMPSRREDLPTLKPQHTERRHRAEGWSTQPSAEDLRSQAKQVRLCAKSSPSPPPLSWNPDSETLCADDLRAQARQIRLRAKTSPGPYPRQRPDRESSRPSLISSAPRSSPTRHPHLEDSSTSEDVRVQKTRNLDLRWESPERRRDVEPSASPPPRSRQTVASPVRQIAVAGSKAPAATQGDREERPRTYREASPAAATPAAGAPPACSPPADDSRYDDKVIGVLSRSPPGESPVRHRCHAATYDISSRRRPKTEENTNSEQPHEHPSAEESSALRKSSLERACPKSSPKRARPEEFANSQPSRSVRRVYKMHSLRSSSLGPGLPSGAVSKTRSVSMTQSAKEFRNLEWLLPRLADFLFIGNIAAMARMSSHSWQVVQTLWARMMLARGFTKLSMVSLSLDDIIRLEQWGGQYWDVWRRAGPKREYRCMLRHWQYGTTVLLSGTSNGWFEFQVQAHDRPQIFYSSGVCGKAGMFANLGEHSELELDISQMAAGSRPLLEIPFDAATWWRWKLVGDGCLTVLYGPPANTKKRLVFTSTGFSAFMDSCESEPAIVVDRGHIVYKERHGEDQHQDSATEGLSLS